MTQKHTMLCLSNKTQLNKNRLTRDDHEMHQKNDHFMSGGRLNANTIAQQMYVLMSFHLQEA